MSFSIHLNDRSLADLVRFLVFKPNPVSPLLVRDFICGQDHRVGGRGQAVIGSRDLIIHSLIEERGSKALRSRIGEAVAGGGTLSTLISANSRLSDVIDNRGFPSHGEMRAFLSIYQLRFFKSSLRFATPFPSLSLLNPINPLHPQAEARKTGRPSFASWSRLAFRLFMTDSFLSYSNPTWCEGERIFGGLRKSGVLQAMAAGVDKL